MKIIVLVPLYNDWQCLYKLVELITKNNNANKEEILEITFLIVNDNSTEQLNINKLVDAKVKVIDLVRNLGHQKAIAVGLSYIAEHMDASAVVVMDVDGEDKPEHVFELVKASKIQKEKIIFAHRSKRNEGFSFRLFYMSYKLIFRLLTGQKISFGNFCILPFEQVKKIVYVSEIWNHFSGGVIRSRSLFTTLPLERGIRFFGTSKMNFISLVLHGLSAVSIYLDVMAVRLIVFTVGLITLSFFGIACVVAIRLFTELAIPGWASFITFGLLNIIIQAFIIGLLMVFLVLSNRIQKHFIPAREYNQFVYKISGFNI